MYSNHQKLNRLFTEEDYENQHNQEEEQERKQHNRAVFKRPKNNSKHEARTQSKGGRRGEERVRR